jgi:hypothetical protein
MLPTIDLERVKKRAYIAYHNDGIIDLCAGPMLILFGFGALFDFLSTLVIVAYTPVIFIPVLKKAFTFPRLGYVKFDESEETAKKAKLFIALLLFFVFGILVFFLFEAKSRVGISDAFIWKNFGVLIGLVLVVIALFVAHSQKIIRLYYYCGLIAICCLSSRIYPLKLPYYLLLIGGVVTITGIVLFIQFLKKYPLPPKVPGEA